MITGANTTVQVVVSCHSAHFQLQVRALYVYGGASQVTLPDVLSFTFTYS
ncbi:hypothetical protein ACNIU4_26730 [Escherichia coli]